MSANMDRSQAALWGVRVLDFTNLLAGPFPSLLLGLLGAEVVKIESKAQLDAARRVPYSTGDPDRSPVFNTINLNKMSLQLNLKQPQAIRLVHTLVSICDAVVENMRPGVMERLGLGYQHLRKINPTLVYASISGAGSTGPESTYPGYAPAFSAMAGVGHLTGYPDGPPAEFHDSIDCRVGATAAFAILSALFQRLRTGQGQFIDLSSTEAITVFTGEALMEFAMNGEVATRQGNRSPRMAPHGCYRCEGEDSWVSIAVATEQEWQALCRVANHPEWASDARFADNALRLQNQDALDPLIERWTRNHTPEGTAQLLQSAGVAAAASMSARDLAEDSHLAERGVWQKVHHPVLGTQTVQGPPWNLSETPATVRSAGPLLGQHNSYVLQDLLGTSRDDVENWMESGIVD